MDLFCRACWPRQPWGGNRHTVPGSAQYKCRVFKRKLNYRGYELSTRQGEENRERITNTSAFVALDSRLLREVVAGDAHKKPLFQWPAACPRFLYAQIECWLALATALCLRTGMREFVACYFR